MDLSCLVVAELALFAWREGERLNPGSYDSKLAIAWIMANRVRSGWMGGDWLGVLHAVADHSCSEKEELFSFDYPDPWDNDWLKLMRDCQGMYDGTLRDELTMTPSREALAANLPGTDQHAINQSRPSFFYANLNMPIRPWFIEKILRKSEDHPRTVSIAGGLQLFG